MPINIPDFNYLTPEQANPVGTGLLQGQDIIAKLIANKFAPQQAMADIAQKQAMAKYYPEIADVQKGQLDLASYQKYLNFKGAQMLSGDKTSGSNNFSPPPSLQNTNVNYPKVIADNLPLSGNQVQRLKNYFGNNQGNTGAQYNQNVQNAPTQNLPVDNKQKILNQFAKGYIDPNDPNSWPKTNLTTDLQNQYQNIQDAERKMAAFAIMGKPETGVAYINAVKNLTPAAAHEVDLNQKIQDKYSNLMSTKSELQPLIEQYNEVLKDIPDKDLTAARLLPNKTLSALKTINPNLQTLASLSSAINSLLPSLRDLPAGAYRSNVELNMINEGGANPFSPKESQYQNNFVLDNFLERLAVNQKYAQNWLNTYKTLQNGWAPVDSPIDYDRFIKKALNNKEYGKAAIQIMSPKQKMELSLYNNYLKGQKNGQ